MRRREATASFDGCLTTTCTGAAAAQFSCLPAMPLGGPVMSSVRRAKYQSGAYELKLNGYLFAPAICNSVEWLHARIESLLRNNHSNVLGDQCPSSPFAFSCL